MLLVLASVMMASAPVAQDPPKPAKPTRQAIFDRAVAAMDAGKCEDAVRDFQSIEAGTARMSPAVAGTVSARKGLCLIRLGRGEEGEAALRTGLAKLGPLGPAYAGDVRAVRLALGRMATARYDYGAAEQEFAAALALSQGQGRAEPLLLLARTTMFDDGPKPLAYADEALALVAADPETNKDSIAAARTMRARVLLNQGQNKPGYDELRAALKLQGGLSLKVSQADVATRGDLALAALLNKDEDDARRYLAYTGAGRLKDGPLARAVSLETPTCGDEAGLRPEDSTIVEFGINPDGSAAYAVPIWSTGDRAVALEFARAVSGWSWTPEAAAAIPPFQRGATRVQLRCTTVGERPPLTGVLEEATKAWLAGKGVAMGEQPDSDARALPMAKAALAKFDGAPGALGRIPPLVSLGGNPMLPDAERAAYLDEANRIAVGAGAPVGMRTWLGLRALSFTAWDGKELRNYRDALRRMLADPAVAADPHSAGVVGLTLARSGAFSKAAPDTDQLLAAVAGDARLPADDPLRVAALLQQSARATAAGRIEEARAAFERTGLTEQQCALLGIQPALKRMGASSADYPMEALNMGFEGWVRVEFDIQADGRTAAQRAVASYPPFIFDDAATGIAKNARYEATYRPSGGAACSGQQRQVVFSKG
jgi:TonB family protein